MKESLRIIYLTPEQAIVYGPRIMAELKRGDRVSVAGIVVQYRAEDIERPGLELTA